MEQIHRDFDHDILLYLNSDMQQESVRELKQQVHPKERVNLIIIN